MAMAVLTSASSLASCAGEGGPDAPNGNTADMPTVTVKIFTPVLNRQTRADGDDQSSTADVSSSTEDPTAVSSTEAEVTSMYLLIYSDADASHPDQVINCSKAQENLDDTQFKGIYENKIKAGKYRFYVIANIDDLIKNGKEEGFEVLNYLRTLSENALQNFSLTFTGTLSGEALPMVVAANEMTLSTGSDATIDEEDGTVDLTSTTTKTTIQGQMTILCAKVRYTFLFDNSTPLPTNSNPNQGFSWPYSSFDVSDVTLEHVYTRCPLFGHASWDAEIDAGNLTKFSIHSTDNKYPYPADIDAFLKNPYTLSGTPDAEDSRKAYQGIVYLPENCATGLNRTLMHLTADLDGVPTNYDIYLPNNNNTGCDEDVEHTSDPTGENVLYRGHFYDVIGKITPVGMQFWVKVEPWVNAGRETFDF